MNVFKKIPFFVLLMGFGAICIAGERPHEPKTVERPREPKTVEERDKLEKQYNTLREDKQNEIAQANQDKKDTTELFSELKIIENERDYARSLINTFEIERAIKDPLAKKNPLAKKLLAYEEEMRTKLNNDLTQKGFTPAEPSQGSGSGVIKQPAEISQNWVEKFFSKVSDLLSRLNFFPAKADPVYSEKLFYTLDASARKEAEAAKKGNISQVEPNITSKYRDKSFVQRIGLYDEAFKNPDRSNRRVIGEALKEDVKQYISELIKSDIEFSLKNTKEKANTYHKEIIDKLRGIEVDGKQINSLNQFIKDTVADIEENFRSPTAVKTANEKLNNFFGNSAKDNFRQDRFEEQLKKIEAKRFANSDEYKKFKTNISKIESMVNQLDNYARFNLDKVTEENRFKLMEFLQNQYSNLAKLYSEAFKLNENTGTVQNTLFTKQENAHKRAGEIQELLINEANTESGRYRSFVNSLNERYTKAQPLDPEAITIAAATIPEQTKKFATLLLDKKSSPLDIETKFNEIISSLNTFIKFAKKADPSQTAVKNAKNILNEINDLQDWIVEYHALTKLTPEQTQKLVNYYEFLDKAHIPIQEQRQNDLSDLFRRYENGPYIFLDKSLKNSGVPYFRSHTEEPLTPDRIEELFNTSREALINPAEESGQIN